MNVTQCTPWPSGLWIRCLTTLALAVLLTVSAQVFAVVDIREFKSPEDEARYHRLIDELRCPKCQNQNLSGSDSQIAQDLRRELYRMINDGDSDKEIKDFMVARYGEYVLYRPRLNENTYALWFGPGVLLLIGIVVLALVVRKRMATPAKTTEAMSDDELNKLNTMLNDTDKDEK